MKKTVSEFFKGIHSLMPFWASNIYMPVVYLLRQLDGLRPREYSIHGKIKDTDRLFRLGYFGNDKRILNYYIQSIFSEATHVEKGARVAIWKASASPGAGDQPYDMVLLEVPGKLRYLIRNKGGFVLPRWVDTRLVVNDTLDALSNRKILKVIEENSFSCHESTAQEDLRFFYERMFRPYIMNRHHDASVMVDYSYFKKRMGKKDSSLFILVKDGVPQVASFNERINGTMKFSGIGVLDGNEDIIRTGAIRALYYFMLTRYHERGVNVINFGGTSPLLSDGLTRFKRSLRAIPKVKNLYGEKSLLLIPWKESASVGEMLKWHPFLYLSHGMFYRALFPDASVLGSKREFISWLKQYQFLGIAGTRIYCRTHLDDINQWISEESLSGYEVLPYPIIDR